MMNPINLSNVRSPPKNFLSLRRIRRITVSCSYCCMHCEEGEKELRKSIHDKHILSLLNFEM